MGFVRHLCVFIQSYDVDFAGVVFHEGCQFFVALDFADFVAVIQQAANFVVNPLADTARFGGHFDDLIEHG